MEVGAKRKPAEDDADLAQTQSQKMQKAWVERHSQHCAKATWRPLIKHRVGAKHWIQNIDNQIRQSTELGGLAFFRFDDKRRGLCQHWSTWPYLSIAMDLGPKGLAGYNSMERFFGLNVDKMPDHAHGCNRDFDMSLARMGLKGFWMIMMVVWNA